MALPRLQGHEQARGGQFGAVTDEIVAGQQVLQAPVPRYVRPVEGDPRLRRLAGEVDHHHVRSVAVTGPGPGQEVPEGLVVLSDVDVIKYAYRAADAEG